MGRNETIFIAKRISVAIILFDYVSVVQAVQIQRILLWLANILAISADVVAWYIVLSGRRRRNLQHPGECY